MNVARATVLIDLELRFALFGLECALGVLFTGAECERVFREAVEDRNSEKRYSFFESGVLTVSGRVDEYEPDFIELHVRGQREIHGIVQHVAEGAKFHAARMRASMLEKTKLKPDTDH